MPCTWRAPAHRQAGRGQGPPRRAVAEPTSSSASSPKPRRSTRSGTRTSSTSSTSGTRPTASLLHHGVPRRRSLSDRLRREHRLDASARAVDRSADRGRWTPRTSRHHPPRSQARQHLPLSRGDDSDFVKVLDFGIAKLTAGRRRGQRTRPTPARDGHAEVHGPRAVRGEGRSITAPTSIRSACMLYEMLTGKVPFGGEATARSSSST